MKTDEIKMTPRLQEWLRTEYDLDDDQDFSRWESLAQDALREGTLSASKYLELTGDTMKPDPERVFGGGGDGHHLRVKDASESYSEKRYTAKHAKTGQTVYDPVHEQECRSMSEASKARHGVLFKSMARKAGILTDPATEHEKALLTEVCERSPWCGKIGSEHYDYIGGDTRVKALIDDAVSGGLEIVPIEFDSDVISFPLLGGELFPLVDLKPVPRGRRIEGASIGTPTMAWGGGDDTAIALFNTAAMVGAIDTTIFTIDGCVEIGRDFLADSPVAVGETLTGLVGDRLRNELDRVIALGNGGTEPEGLFVAGGVGVMVTANGIGGPPTVGDYITLLFSLAKQYRNRNLQVVFVSNDTTYQRSRQIRIDTGVASTDQRPALSPLVKINDYDTLGWGHKIQNGIGNSLGAIAAMKKYRMYRRLGLEIRFEQGGRTLARANEVLMVYRARFGGRLMDGNAMAKWTTGQA